MSLLRTVALSAGILLVLLTTTIMAYATGGGRGAGGHPGGGEDGWRRDAAWARAVAGQGLNGHTGRTRAQALFEDCLGRCFAGNFSLAPIADFSAHYQSHVLDSRGEPVARLTVDTRTGALYRESLGRR